MRIEHIYLYVEEEVDWSFASYYISDWVQELKATQTTTTKKHQSKHKKLIKIVTQRNCFGFACSIIS